MNIYFLGTTVNALTTFAFKLPSPAIHRRRVNCKVLIFACLLLMYYSTVLTMACNMVYAFVHNISSGEFLAAPAQVIASFVWLHLYV